MQPDQVALRVGSRVAGAQVGHAESALRRGLGLVLVILVWAVKGRWQVSAPRVLCVCSSGLAGSYRSPRAVATSAMNGGEQELVSVTAARLPDGHSGPAAVDLSG